MAIFLIFSPTSIHLHPLQVENCDSNSRLVVDEDDNGKFRLEMVKISTCRLWLHMYQHRYITNVSTRALWALNARQFAHLSCILLANSQCNISPSTYVFFYFASPTAAVYLFNPGNNLLRLFLFLPLTSHGRVQPTIKASDASCY